jgi:hypothetical protein
MNSTHPGTVCKITVVNDILDTRSEEISPQSPEEAIQNHGQVALARHFILWYGDSHEPRLDGTFVDQPVAVAIHRTADSVIVHWCPDGDLEAARDRMREILSGGNWWTCSDKWDGEEGCFHE